MVFSYWFVLSYKNIKKIFTFWHTCLLFILKNACYSETKYYLCKQNNKRSLLGRKQRSRVARSFPNRYLFGLCDKVTSLFSTSCILDIILTCKSHPFNRQISSFHRFTDSNSERLSTLFKLPCDRIDNETTHYHIGGNKWMTTYSVNRLPYRRGGIMESFKPFV